MNAEPTQAYHFDGAAAEEEKEEGGEEEPMDCDATVAYRIEGKKSTLCRISSLWKIWLHDWFVWMLYFPFSCQLMKMRMMIALPPLPF